MIGNTHPAAVLFEARGLKWKTHVTVSSDDLRLEGTSGYLHGTKLLFDAVVEPKLHLLAGEFYILGAPAREALRSGEAGFCPSHLPAPSTTRLIDALTMSAQLLGRSKNDVLRCLEQVGLTASRKEPLLELTPLQERRAGIAHGLITNPKVLLFAQPFLNLTDGGRQALSQLMEQVTRDRLWMVAGEAACPVSQTWRKRAEWIVYSSENRLVATQAALPQATGYFLRLNGATSGPISELKNAGAVVTPSENSRAFLIEALDESQISQICASFSTCTVVSLEPAEEAGFRNSHAKSAL